MTVGKPAPHESAALHVTGAARYVADLPGPPGTLAAWVLGSPHAHARIAHVDATDARAMPGVHAVLFAGDIPGRGSIGPIAHDEPLLADKLVHCVGQAVALVVAETEAQARDAAKRVVVHYTPLAPVLGIDAALDDEAFLSPLHTIARGDLEEAFAGAHLVFMGEVRCGGQEHFYLESQAALVAPEEGGGWRVWSSTQHPTEIQREVAAVLGVGAHRVSCTVPRLGGGFGGKESQATNWAALAAIGAWHTRRPVKLWLHRDDDMAMTGKRHPFLGRYRAAFDAQGHILGLDAQLWSDGGWVIDLSEPVMDRALFHVDNAYYLPAVRLRGRVCRTNAPSNTAFRGFGGPQGMLVVEHALDAASRELGLDPAEIRVRNFYGAAPRDRTPYGQQVTHNRLARMWSELSESSDYAARVSEVEAFNETSTHRKRGLALQPVKFGISFTKSLLNQAGALVHVYSDGTVQLNHGGTEMGQGLHTKMLAVCATAFGLPLSAIRQMDTSTEKVPNTSPTAASAGADLNGQAVAAACAKLLSRMQPVAAELLGAPADAAPRFEAGCVHHGDRSISFQELATACWVRRISLSATGYYATPGIAYDHATGRGTPFKYFAYGMAVVEAQLCGLTGEHRLRRVDILHDVGASLVPSIDLGQVEGAFVQGMGWLTCEELVWDDQGRLRTPGPSTYKIPAAGDVPREFRVALLERAPQDEVIHGSKAVGEPPFMLALGVVGALRQAVAAFGPRAVSLSLPATPEALLRAIEDQRAGGREAAK